LFIVSPRHSEEEIIKQTATQRPFAFSCQEGWVDSMIPQSPDSNASSQQHFCFRGENLQMRMRNFLRTRTEYCA
jgi:hypothetical protein